MTLIQTEPKKIYYGEPIIVSDMQGPCPDGFHVPTKDECVTLLGILTTTFGLASNGTTMVTYLKMPYTGWLSRTNATAEQKGSYGAYWSSTYSDVSKAYSIYFRAAATSGDTKNDRAAGATIRAFKNIPSVPNSSWTTLYDGSSVAAGAGVFHNATDGLISVSGDGTTWITIADKNLGATQVFNSGDTLSETNCGKYYQWGNNYGFPFAGSITTSSTQVDASDYGPGNYYESSTFITRSSTPYRWDTTDNANLRGGVTQGTSEKPKEIKAVYLGTTKVRPAGPDKDYLCFTAEQANSTVTLNKNGSPTAVTLETSTDGLNWTDYTFGNAITLSAIGDKVYWRNKSETVTNFSTSTSNYYLFYLTGKVGASGDTNFLLCNNSTTTIPNDYCFFYLFYNNSSLTSAPKLPATTLTNNCYYRMFAYCGLKTATELPATTLKQKCYYGMFYYCTELTEIPKLSATTLQEQCYYQMFQGCSKIKMAAIQTGEYQTAYRIPTTGTGTPATNATFYMFNSTGGAFTGTPSINTTYYTSNTVV